MNKRPQEGMARPGQGAGGRGTAAPAGKAASPPAAPQPPRTPLSDPLTEAVSGRDRGTVGMVERALAHREVMLAFQPVMQAHAPARPVFYEGLLRVLDETGRIIPARNFMGALENHELGRVLDCLALEEGLAALAQEPGLRLSINMSARSIGYPRWINTLNAGIGRDPTCAERLILEISEASVMTLPEVAQSFIGELQLQGVAFALDGFGAGAFALRHLGPMGFDLMKLDGRLTGTVATDAEAQRMVGLLVTIARTFEMFTVAQAVESTSQLQAMAALGVDCVQGYALGAPRVTPPWKAEAPRTGSAG
jgi:EAL domain-containing protein (putative c-di-GMP-specific phosphodiesterase class I)